MKNKIKNTLNLEAFKISKLTNHRFIIGGIQHGEDSESDGNDDETLLTSGRKCLK